MAKTVLIESKPGITKVGTSGTPLEYYVQTQYQVDDSGKLIAGSAKSFIAYNNSTIPGVKNFVQAAETTDGGTNWTFKNGTDGKPIFGADAQRSLKEGALRTDTQKAIVDSAKNAENPLNAEDQKKLAASTKNQATTPPEGGGGENNPQATPEEQEASKKENESFKEGTRLKYPDVYYPLNLSLEHQDCIRFSILEYQPSLNAAVRTSGEITSDLGRPKVDIKNILGSITLPIPAGINDSNTVNWQTDELSLLQQAGATITTNTMTGGGEAAEAATGSILSRLSASTKTGELQQGISGSLGGIAVGKNTIQQRTFGSIFNNNLELLFNGPGLRTFSFTFKLSPRNPPEAKAVMTIIRYFKQAMSVKRSQTTLLLKTPRTFSISYLTSNQEHPYLNKFKECALTGFNVDYTPEGQYMTYMSSKIDERSMISYSISLQFQELEPVFDDEYNNETTITNIGY